MARKDRITKSRAGRAAKIAGASAGIAAREATARAATLGAREGSTRGQALATRQQLKSAKALVKLLAGMRGAAMKVGQTLSAVDLGLVPEEIRGDFQEILATLQQSAEPVSAAAIVKVIEADLGEKLKDAFAEFDREPIAAASVGQVHRATLHDGRDVAVKVQYPGIAEAIQADMQNLRLGLKLLTVIAPGIDTGEIAAEIRERITEELDYELEAQNHREMARVYRGHPFVLVPGVVTELCRERVLVTDYVDGERFAAAREKPQAERDRLGEILARFYINGPLRHRLLNGDPHPGNSLFLADGRVAFLDFGFFKHLTDADVRQMLASTRATYDRDPQALMDVITELGALPEDSGLVDTFFAAYESIFGWLMAETPTTADGARTAEMMRHYNELRRADGFDQLKLPHEHFVLLRAVFLLIGLEGQLAATNTWLDIGREWLLGDEPATELGRVEEEFFAGRFEYPAVAGA